MPTTALVPSMKTATVPLTQRARYDTLVRDHGRAVHRYLIGMLGDEQAAEDAAQEVFLRAWRGLDSLRDADRARSWLFAIAANTARTQHKRRGRNAHQDLHRPGLEDVGADTDMAARSDRSLHVRRVLASLAEEDRQIVLLVGLEGLTAVEAAEVVGISVPAARKRWQRACARFRARLEGGAA
jgi:RNA polymerase sigma-70 factor (ECF subfamily)